MAGPNLFYNLPDDITTLATPANIQQMMTGGAQIAPAAQGVAAPGNNPKPMTPAPTSPKPGLINKIFGGQATAPAMSQAAQAQMTPEQAQHMQDLLKQQQSGSGWARALMLLSMFSPALGIIPAILAGGQARAAGQQVGGMYKGLEAAGAAQPGPEDALKQQLLQAQIAKAQQLPQYEDPAVAAKREEMKNKLIQAQIDELGARRQKDLMDKKQQDKTDAAWARMAESIDDPGERAQFLQWREAARGRAAIGLPPEPMPKVNFRGHPVLSEGAQAAVAASAARHKGGLPLALPPQKGAEEETKTGGGKLLDEGKAAAFLKAAGGDKNKARGLAKKAGYSF